MTRLCLFLCITLVIMGNTCAPFAVVSTCTQAGQATLTFDDGITNSTSRILDVLNSFNVKATFFLIGETLTSKTFPVLKRAYDSGHTIGNHTWSHRSLPKLNTLDLKNEILTTQNGFLPLSQTPIKKYIRPPYGAINYTSYKLLTAEGFTVVLWNIDLKDWMGHRSRDQLWASFQRQLVMTTPLKDSLIILLHSKEKTADILPDLIFTLRANDYQIVSLEKCLSPT